VQLEEDSGVLLHIAPFTDSKKILCLLTPEYGKLKVVWRGSKKQSRPKLFTPCSFAWKGKSGLKTLTQMDEQQAAMLTSGRSLFCGMYLNELAVRLLPEHVAIHELYDSYLETLQKLAQSENQNIIMEILLRRFEFALLNTLGVGVNLDACSAGKPIEESDSFHYRFISDEGFRLEYKQAIETAANVFSGRDIISIQKQNWDVGALKAAKRLSRLALAPLLGDKPIKSRELFT